MEEGLGGCVVFVQDVLLDLLGDFLFLVVDEARAHDVEVLPEEALPIDDRLQELLYDLVLHVH